MSKCSKYVPATGHPLKKNTWVHAPCDNQNENPKTNVFGVEGQAMTMEITVI